MTDDKERLNDANEQCSQLTDKVSRLLAAIDHAGKHLGNRATVTKFCREVYEKERYCDPNGKVVHSDNFPKESLRYVYIPLGENDKMEGIEPVKETPTLNVDDKGVDFRNKLPYEMCGEIFHLDRSFDVEAFNKKVHDSRVEVSLVASPDIHLGSQTCGGCVYWGELNTKCSKPRVSNVVGPGVRARWPITARDMWCDNWDDNQETKSPASTLPTYDSHASIVREDPSTEKCGNCKYWGDGGDPGSLECDRRDCGTANNETRAAWPDTASRNWCGAWTPSEAKPDIRPKTQKCGNCEHWAFSPGKSVCVNMNPRSLPQEIQDVWPNPAEHMSCFAWKEITPEASTPVPLTITPEDVGRHVFSQPPDFVLDCGKIVNIDTEVVIAKNDITGGLYCLELHCEILDRNYIIPGHVEDSILFATQSDAIRSKISIDTATAKEMLAVCDLWEQELSRPTRPVSPSTTKGA